MRAMQSKHPSESFKKLVPVVVDAPETVTGTWEDLRKWQEAFAKYDANVPDDSLLPKAPMFWLTRTLPSCTNDHAFRALLQSRSREQTQALLRHLSELFSAIKPASGAWGLETAQFSQQDCIARVLDALKVWHRCRPRLP